MNNMNQTDKPKTASDAPEAPIETHKSWCQSMREIEYAPELCDCMEAQPAHSPLPWEAQLIFPGQYALVPVKYAKHTSSWSIGNIHGQNCSESDAKLIVASVNHAEKLAQALERAIYSLRNSDKPLARLEMAQSAQAALNAWKEAK